MNRKTFSLVPVLLSVAMLVLNLGLVHAQTPRQIPVFDQPGTGTCSSVGANDCIDSVITQDTSGNIGIGTMTPSNRLHLVTTSDSYPGLNIEGDVATFNGVNVNLLNRNGGNTNPWVLGTGGVLGPHFFSIGDFFGYRLVIDDRTGRIGIGTVNPSAKLEVVGGNDLGVYGESITSFGVWGYSTNHVGVEGVTESPAFAGVRAISAGNGSPANLGLDVRGRLTATGTKNAVVPLQDGQHVLLTAEESTEVWFSDYGTAQLVNGRAVVQIDRVYLQTVNTEKDYHVFLTARGNPKGALYIDNESPSSFEIRESTGTANIKVSYRIVAKRKDFADERLKKVDAPLAYLEPTTKGDVSARADLQATERMAALP